MMTTNKSFISSSVHYGEDPDLKRGSCWDEGGFSSGGDYDDDDDDECCAA